MELLTRTQFREQVLERDNHCCVICHRSLSDGIKLDAHHIIERRLWEDGGYYIDNGATLCDEGPSGCHWAAEETKHTVEDVRRYAGIQTAILPDDMYHDLQYDKWGNVYMANGMRTKGPLFDDESVQKVLAHCIDDFTEYVKYPRTLHLPWSPGITKDDRVHKDMSNFEGQQVVVTEKMDGENFTGYQNYCHARSVDGRSHYTRNWAKTFWSQRSFNLNAGWRVCAENLWAEHSITYDELESFLLVFSIWDNDNFCLDWNETKEFVELLDMTPVKVLYEGIYDEEHIKSLYNTNQRNCSEGYVVRNANKFHYKDFNKNVGKYVRANHVQTAQLHWFYGRSDHKANKLKT